MALALTAQEARQLEEALHKAIASVLRRYRTDLKIAKQIAVSMALAFAPGEVVRFNEKSTKNRGADGVVKRTRGKVVLVDVNGVIWKCPPQVLDHVAGGRK